MISLRIKISVKLVQFLTFIATIPFTPVVFLVVAGLGLYRSAVSCIFRYRFGSRFAGMVTGIDAMWVLDEPQCSGIVNVLTFVHEANLDRTGATPEEIIEIFKQRLQALYELKRHQVRKAFFKRNCSLGYCFWTKEKEINLESFIQPLELNGDINEIEFRGLLTEICKNNFSSGNTWQLLVGMQSLTDVGKGFARYPIIFRFHHSIGDGISLLRLFLEEIEDSKLEPERIRNIATKVAALQESTFVTSLRAIYSIPYFIIQNIFFEDKPNCLQKTLKTSEKVICWQSEQNILPVHCWTRLVKKAKTKCLKIQSSTVLLAALSGTLGRYFQAKGQRPTLVTISMPTRFISEGGLVGHSFWQDLIKSFFLGNSAKLANKYTAHVQKLPITNFNDDMELNQLLDKLSNLKQASKVVRSSSDLLINYWALTILPTICPIPILRILSDQFRITADVSIMPELQHRFRVGRYEFEELYFWSPLFGNTGVNISALCYGGELRLALLADRSVIGSAEEGQQLIDDLLREIQSMNILLS